jgi:hypothetical protein
MFCTQCGKRVVGEGGAYCAHCGARVAGNGKQVEGSRPEPKRFELRPARLAQAVGALVTIGLAVYWILVPAKEGPHTSSGGGYVQYALDAQRAANAVDWPSALVPVAVAAVVFVVLYVGALLSVRWMRGRARIGEEGKE